MTTDWATTSVPRHVSDVRLFLEKTWCCTNPQHQQRHPKQPHKKRNIYTQVPTQNAHNCLRIPSHRTKKKAQNHIDSKKWQQKRTKSKSTNFLLSRLRADPVAFSAQRPNGWNEKARLTGSLNSKKWVSSDESKPKSTNFLLSRVESTSPAFSAQRRKRWIEKVKDAEKNNRSLNSKK